jgi:hypothetical protein
MAEDGPSAVDSYNRMIFVHSGPPVTLHSFASFSSARYSFEASAKAGAENAAMAADAAIIAFFLSTPLCSSAKYHRYSRRLLRCG